jgi:hypothetical protein
MGRLRLSIWLIHLLSVVGCATQGVATRPEDAQVPQIRPRFTYEKKVGCADLAFHAHDVTRTEFLQIEADFQAMSSPSRVTVFNLADAPRDVKVSVTLYNHPEVNQPNCSDMFVREIGAPPLVAVVWPAMAGRLVVERGPTGINPDEPSLFHAKLRLEGAVFRGPNGIRAEMPAPFVWEGDVGWYAGT